MLSRADLKRFLADDGGNVTLEVVVVFVPLMAIVLGVFELAVSFYFILSAQKAAQLGARVVAARAPIYTGPDMPSQNVVNIRYGQFGDACYQPDGNDACIDPGGPFVCSAEGGVVGGNCDPNNFESMLMEMRRVFPRIDPSDVVVIYEYERLGYAGGPFVPRITVTILPHQSPFSLLLFNWDLTRGGSESGDSGATFLRGVSASSFGEDLS
ncbi:MAG: TadE/TadG family type IV pilus assembly protein [Pseudomonadota bacterium]